MPVTVRTFDQLGAAASALASERNACFLGGGTVVMRLLNEGHTEFSTLVRTTDRDFREIRTSSGRIMLGAGVTMAAILARPDRNAGQATGRLRPRIAGRVRRGR